MSVHTQLTPGSQWVPRPPRGLLCFWTLLTVLHGTVSWTQLSTLPWLLHLGPSALAGVGRGKAVYLTAQLRPKFQPRQVYLTFLYVISEKSTQRKQLTNGIIKNVTIGPSQRGLDPHDFCSPCSLAMTRLHFLRGPPRVHDVWLLSNS